jgi:ribosomal protein S12 methylthiotransferase accessory factor
MPVESKKSKLKLIVQPRLSSRNYLYQYYAHIINETGKEDSFGKGGGVSFDKERAKMKAIGEALERYWGSQITKPLIKKSFRELKNKALNPQRVIYFSPKQYYKKEFPYERYHSAIPIHWTKGYSLINKRILWVPAFSVFLGFNRVIKEEPRFMPTTSNGLAVHTNLRNATLAAIFELVERDSLMITWYTKRVVPQLDFQTIKLSEFQNLYQRIVEEGFLVGIWIITLDIPIPVALAIIYDNKQKIPYASFGAGASNSIEKAALKALEEALIVREVLETLKNQKKIKPISPSQVNTFLDHAIFYAHPKWKIGWKFFLKSPIYTVQEIEKNIQFPHISRIVRFELYNSNFQKKKDGGNKN